MRVGDSIFPMVSDCSGLESFLQCRIKQVPSASCRSRFLVPVWSSVGLGGSFQICFIIENVTRRGQLLS